jgi:methylenetetrahydrofolate dehydrogenase (NADP+)/methenyltetrahydrofolate cyclohydrolase
MEKEVVIMRGEEVAEAIYEKISKGKANSQKKIKLVILLVGNNPASLIYIKQKIKACEKLGFECQLEHLKNPEEVSTKSLIKKIEEFNNDEEVTGIIVQMPLPEHINKTEILAAIDRKKDVDGLNPFNMGQTFLGVEFEDLTPCTATGVIRMMEYYQVELVGKKVVVIGSGNIAGKPTAMMMSNRKATVTVCNSKTVNLKEITLGADVIVVAVGQKCLLMSDMVKKGAVVVDIGINRNEDGSLCGDSEYEKLLDKVKAITPVPGGVGKMTVACLMENLAKAGQII